MIKIETFLQKLQFGTSLKSYGEKSNLIYMGFGDKIFQPDEECCTEVMFHQSSKKIKPGDSNETHFQMFQEQLFGIFQKKNFSINGTI